MMKKYSKVAIILLLVAMLLAAGCGKEATAQDKVLSYTEPAGDEIVIPENSPLNTVSDCEYWGDEANFLKLAIANGLAKKENFASGEIEFESGLGYVALVHLHNTSESDLDDVTVIMSHPKTVVDDANEMVATVIYGGGDGDSFSSVLTLKTDEPVTLTPMEYEDTGLPVSILDYNDERVEYNVDGYILGGNALISTRISTMPADTEFLLLYTFSATALEGGTP